MALRTFSFGGGWQSTTALVLAAHGELDYRTFLMANVGSDSENPHTIRYVEEHAAPFAAAHGLNLHLLDRHTKAGEVETIRQRIISSNGSRQTIPIYLSNGKPGSRVCTREFKIDVTGAWLKAHGASPDNPATVGMGITLDEIGRANPNKAMPYERLEYPLLELGLRRADCPAIIRSVGLPMPPKSSCDFCPIRKIHEWQDMYEREPERWDRACEVEDTINGHLARRGRPPVFLTPYRQPLRALFRHGTQLPLIDDDADACSNGWCMT
ncbi:phosphoadenosine phosphosulfate reductase [Streptomyces sp. NPDC002467]|uniref:phosphoadenosine phosphosulfate reductase n=1 Tax=Streptomyces sp. NPDC002467 TaxID=3364647 RepID=UPI0036C5B973